MDSGIYRITCTANGKNYIGSAKWIKKRISKHKWCLRKNCHTNPHLQNAFSLYGEEAFVFEIQEICAIDDLKDREQHWMDQLEVMDKTKGFNIVPYSDRRKMSPETKARISRANKGKVRTEEAKENMRRAQRNRSAEWNKRISEGQTGLKSSEKAKKNMSEARKKLLASGYVSPRKGQKASEETRRKISEANRGRVPPNNKACRCLETGQQFISIAEAARSIGVAPAAMSTAIRRNGRCRKLTFKVKK